MMKILCFLGFHNWKYISKEERLCKNCSKKEILINEGPVSGLADFRFWKKVD